MARANTKPPTPAVLTHEGAPAVRINAELQLRRSVLACLLWEDTFYESGEDIAARIRRLALIVEPSTVAALAIEARSVANLRHVPLLLLSALARSSAGTGLLGNTIPVVVQRADELAELLAVHATAEGVPIDKVKKALSAQMKKGLARAFTKFDEYALAKYNRDGAITLRDVLFMVHAKPKDEAQAALFKRLIDGTMATPDTWEVKLSGGADKRETFTRLVTERMESEGRTGLGYFALLRNLRNMREAGVDEDLVNAALIARGRGAERILPFRYVAAVRAAPSYAYALDIALKAAIGEMEALPGKTAIVVDNSLSMTHRMSGKSELSCIDAAATLASIWPTKVPGDLRVFVFSDTCTEVPAYRGLAGVDALKKGMVPRGTNIGQAVRYVGNKMDYDRIIVITDEQSHDSVGAPRLDATGKHVRGYMINVAAYQNGVGYGKWTHIDGFSENVIRFIAEFEKADAAGNSPAPDTTTREL